MENLNTSGCSEGQGRLPDSCADLVFPYIPIQCSIVPRYEREEGLAKGTLFPGLALPFTQDLQDAMACQNESLCQLMAIGFAVMELNLYLDTHPEDMEALRLFSNYVNLEKEAKRRYEAQNGDLYATSLPSLVADTWVQEPWPWDLEGKK